MNKLSGGTTMSLTKEEGRKNENQKEILHN